MYFWNKPAGHTQWDQPKAPAVAMPTALPKASRPAAAGGGEGGRAAPAADSGGGAGAEGGSEGAAAAAGGGGAEDGGGVVKMLVDSNVHGSGAQGEAARAAKGKANDIEPRIRPSPYADRYLCPIFGCWRPLQNSELSGAVRYYGAKQ